MKGKRKVAKSPIVAEVREAESDTSAVDLTSKYAKLSESDKHTIIYLASENVTQQEIAKRIGCAQSAVSYFLQRIGNPAKVVQAVLKSHELAAAEHWATAVEVAAKRGDHRPARELIETANPELRPQTANQGNSGGVTVIVGMPGAPVQLPTINILASENGAQAATSAVQGGGRQLISASSSQLIEAKPDIPVGETRPKP